MKTHVAFLLMIALVTNFSCEQEVNTLEKYGRISFRVSSAVPRADQVTDHSPTLLLISLETTGGKSIYEDKTFALESLGQDYTTEDDILLSAGSYTITKFIVLSYGKVLYATPREGSEKASLIADALPLVFSVGENKYHQLTPQVVVVQAQDNAQAFGYSSFGFDVVDDPAEEAAWMNVRVKFEPTIGGIFYENVDAEFLIIAYDEADVEKWRTTLPYTGPQPNDLKIKNGFYRYTLEVKKWGITNKQAFTGSYLWERRVRDGVIPTTYVFAGTAEPKKVFFSITYADNNGMITPESKTTYQYNRQGKVVYMSTYRYLKTAARFVIDTESGFEYMANRVSKIETYDVGSETPYDVVTYTYDGEGRPTHITNKSNTSGITTDVNLSYAATDRIITASYQLSNGNGFDYTFTNEWSNMKSDRTTRGSQLCSEGVYTYDKSINPLKHLGYVDYLLRNYSISNRMTEQVNYAGCAYPSLVPEKYSYVYDAEGYPTVATISYKGKSERRQVHYFYE